MASNKLEHKVDALYKEVKQIIEDSRSKAYQAINVAMIQAYWTIGKLIVTEEQKGDDRAAYGKAVLEELANRLSREFGKGFSNRNLRHIRQFYRTFPIRNALRSELSWTHYRLLLKVEDIKARTYYIKEAAESNWSTRTLDRQIGNLYYERMLMSDDKIPVKKETEEKQVEFLAQDIIKDPYVLDFLNLKNPSAFRESELEQAIIDKLQEFILELGKGFAFVARQYRITAGPKDHFYADLIFYNYILKCFLIIDLKTRPLEHKDIGQMDMYVRYFEDCIRQENDNPTIGLILCTHKNRTIVKYSLLSDSKQIFASKYKVYLPTEKELKHEIETERRAIEMQKKFR